MDAVHELNLALNERIKQQVKYAAELAQVQSYDSATETVKVTLVDGMTVFGVRLTALNVASKIVVVPKIDSWVLIGRIEMSDQFVVLQTSEIERVKGKIYAMEFDIDAQKAEVRKESVLAKLEDDGITLKRGSESVKDVLDSFIDAVKTAQYIAPNGTISTLNPTLQTVFTTLKTRFAAILK